MLDHCRIPANSQSLQFYIQEHSTAKSIPIRNKRFLRAGGVWMATYKEIQGYVKETYGFLPKTCWIAHMKELCGIPVKNVPNRISPSHREKTCPPEKMPYVKEAFRHFGMI